MKNFEYLADEIYEFFDEIIGSIVPGLYFCSYIIFNILAVFFAFEIKLERQSSIVLLLILTISYVIGTMFRRSNSREPDSKSARYTYYKSCPHDDNDYAFGKMMPNDTYKDFINEFVLLANQNKISYNESIVIKRKLKGKTKLKNISKQRKNDLLSKPFIIQYINETLQNKRESLNNEPNDYCKARVDDIDKFLTKYDVYHYCDIFVDYPYNNLKQYLLDRELDNLADYIDWGILDDNTKTARSKSLICNMKIYIRHTSPKDYGQLLKTEAHIRFMNALWHANKLLKKLIWFMTALTGVAYALSMIITSFKLLKKLYAYNNGFSEFIKSIIIKLKAIMDCLLHGKNPGDYVLLALLYIFIISIIYLAFYFIIDKTIRNNFHYQRIREVVSVLYLFDLLMSEKNKEKNVSELNENDIDCNKSNSQ